MNSLFTSLIISFVKLNNYAYDINLEDYLIRIISHNDLDDDKNVPKWLFSVFEALLNKTVLERKRFYEEENITGDYANFLAELETVLEGEFDDYGEDIKIKLPRLDMYVLIIFESSEYEVGYL